MYCSLKGKTISKSLCTPLDLGIRWFDFKKHFHAMKSDAASCISIKCKREKNPLPLSWGFVFPSPGMIQIWSLLGIGRINMNTQSETCQEESSTRHLFGHFQPLFSSNLISLIIESQMKKVSDWCTFTYFESLLAGCQMCNFSISWGTQGIWSSHCLVNHLSPTRTFTATC